MICWKIGLTSVLSRTKNWFRNYPIIHSQANFTHPSLLNSFVSDHLPNPYKFEHSKNSSCTPAFEWQSTNAPGPSGNAIQSNLCLPSPSLSYVPETMVIKDTPTLPLPMYLGQNPGHTLQPLLKTSKTSLFPMICPTISSEFTVLGWSPSPEDPFNTTATSGQVLKDNVIHRKLPIFTWAFENSQITLIELQGRIFNPANKCKPKYTNDKVRNILQISKISVQAYINGLEKYAKAKNQLLRKDQIYTICSLLYPLPPRNLVEFSIKWYTRARMPVLVRW